MGESLMTNCNATTAWCSPCGRGANYDFGPVALCWMHAEQVVKDVESAHRYRFDGISVDLDYELRQRRLALDKLVVERKRLMQQVAALRKERERVRQWLVERRPLANGTRRRVIERDERTCRYCHVVGTTTNGGDGRPWHIDHAVPVSRGGTNDDANLVLACARCNQSKHDRTLDEFVAQLSITFPSHMANSETHRSGEHMTDTAGKDTL